MKIRKWPNNIASVFQAQKKLMKMLGLFKMITSTGQTDARAVGDALSCLQIAS